MNNRKNKNYLLLALCFIVILGIIFIPNIKKNYKDIGSNKYATAQIEGFEKSLFGSTGWAAIDLPLKESASGTSNTVVTVSAGQPFLILGQSGSYWEIKYNDYHGYIEHNYCMINLPDVVPSIKYNIANSYSAIYKSSGYDVDGATGETLYGTNCSNGLCQKIGDNGKVMNNKIGRSEHIVPSLYSTSLKIARAQTLALNDGYSLMIYDSYRPRSVSTYVAQKLGVLYNSNSTVRSNIDTSTGASGTTYSWGQAWFLAQGMSSHNVGSAIDVTLFKDGEVVMPTAMHELSTAAIKYYSPTAPRDSSGYSTGMLNNESAQKLDNYMTSVGMGTLASEWWHFQDNEGLNLLRNATSENGCDFQATSVLSNYGFTNNLTTVGDVNGDGFINEADAELIYNLYKFLQTNTCDTCGNLISYSDINNNSQLDLGDVYSILNSNNDLVTSSMYSITNSYINAGVNTFDSQNIILKNIQGLSLDVDNENNKVLVKYHGDLIKEYDIVSYSYTDHDLTKPYIFSQGGIQDIEMSILSHNFSCINCVIDVNSNNNKVYIKKDSNDQQNLAEYDVVYFTSPYFTDDGIINSPVVTVGQLLDSINCYNCEASVYNNSSVVSSGNIPAGSELVVKESVSGNSDILKSVSINFAVSGVELNKSNLSLATGQSERLSVVVSPNNATNNSVSWESSDTSVVTVDNSGNVTAVGLGSAIITVTTSDGGYTDTCDITVTGPIKYTVTYSDGNQTYTQLYEADEIIIFKNDLIKLGYTLTGWRYNNHYYGLNDVLNMPANDIELTAVWELNEPVIGNSKYSLNNSIVTGIDIGIDVSNIDLQLPSIYSYSIYDKDDNIKSQGKIGTGNKIKIYLNTENNKFVTEYIVSIKGDLNGNGMVNVMDLNDLRTFIKSTYNNVEVGLCYRLAGDMNNSGKINVMDLNDLRQYIKQILSSSN